MSKIKSYLTNGYSGWLRILILIVGMTMSYTALKSDVKYLSLNLQKHEECSKELVCEFKKELKDIRTDFANRIEKVIDRYHPIIVAKKV